MSYKKVSVSLEVNWVDLLHLSMSLYNAKFLNHNNKSYRLAFERNLGDMLDHFHTLYYEIKPNKNNKYENTEWHFIDDGDHEQELEIAGKHLVDIDDWHDDYSEEEKINLVKDLLYPLNYKEETLYKLIEDRNKKK